MQNIQNNMQDNAPLVSFIVTAYNLPPDMLRECIGSIVALSLGRDEREIIVVDDGSDAFAINDLVDYCDDIVYLRQPNQGLSCARNNGLKMATGKYIQFVDGDDCLLQAQYEHCLDLVRYYDTDIVYFNFTNKREASVPYKHSEPVSGSAFLHNNNLRASACSYVFRASILQNLRFTPGILHEDEEFTPLLFLKAERVMTTDAKAYYYRERQNSIMHTTSDKRHTLRRLEDMERVILRLRDKAGLLPEADSVALNRRVAQLTMDYLYNTIVLTRNADHVEKVVKRLYDKGLFPLPDKKYTRKYQLFAKAAQSKMCRRLMVMALPKLSR